MNGIEPGDPRPQPAVADTCGRVEEACVCTAAADHDEPHACACGGSWTFDAAGEFVVVRFPGDGPTAAFAAEHPVGIALARELFG